MIALIDADLVCFRCAASCKENDPVEAAIERADLLMRDILSATSADEYKSFLTGSGNFRKVINPDYKANRKDQVPPIYLQDVREFLVTEWKSKLGHGLEADDLLGINQTEDTIIASLDKDLRMIPGRHYSWAIGTATWSKDAEFKEVSEEEGAKTFWCQMLIGDKTDNIIGVHGLGPKKSDKIVSGLETNDLCLETVLELYEYDYKRFVMNANCLWIKRHEESEWHTDLNLTLTKELQQEQDMMSKSMKSFIQSI